VPRLPLAVQVKRPSTWHDELFAWGCASLQREASPGILHPEHQRRHHHSNYLTNGIYLPHDDRRHHVA